MATYYHAPALAYYDTFSGLVPCRVISVDEAGALTIRLTANRGAYQRGETIQALPQRSVAPRDRIRRRRFSTSIIGGYVWATNTEDAS
jgi:hypothetical protein